MALPLIAAGIAARAVAKKLATRAAGGITGTGAKQVNPVYRNSPVSKMMGDPSGVKRNQSGSVKIVKGLEKEAKQLGMTKKQWQKTANKGMTDMTKANKSGYSAKEAGALRQWENAFVNTKKPTVKINSNPTRSK